MQIWIDVKMLPTESKVYEVKGYNRNEVHSIRHAYCDVENYGFFAIDFTITHWRAI